MLCLFAVSLTCDFTRFIIYHDFSDTSLLRTSLLSQLRAVSTGILYICINHNTAVHDITGSQSDHHRPVKFHSADIAYSLVEDIPRAMETFAFRVSRHLLLF